MAKKYFVQHDGQNLGPFDREMIEKLVAAAQLTDTDRIYDPVEDIWHTFAELGWLKSQGSSSVLKGMTPDQEIIITAAQAVPPVVALQRGQKKEWFVLKNRNRLGPLSYGEVIKMLQEKSLFEFEYAWKEGMADWKRLAEVSDFHKDQVTRYFAQVGQDGQVFFRRRFARVSYECKLIIHDNNKIWGGKTLELSEGGACIMIENAALQPGQNIYIHFGPGQHSKPFNVLCEIVGKRFVKGVRSSEQPIVYGVKFINIHKQDKDEIKAISVA